MISIQVNNSGYVSNTRDTNNIMDYVNEIKGLPFGIYRYDNLGEILYHLNNKELITKYFNNDDEFKKIKGFLIVEKYNIPSRFKFILDQKKNSKINIVYAYIENNVISIADTMSGNNKFISYNELEKIGKNNTTSLTYNEKYPSKTFILTHIFPFSLFYNDSLYVTSNTYNDDSDFTYDNGISFNRDMMMDMSIDDLRTFYMPNNNRNRTLTNIINSNKLK